MPAPVDFFDEIDFPFELHELTGGTMKPTRIVEMPSGREQRIKLWSRNRRRWTGTLIATDPTLIEAARDFWEARDGPARGFRFKDPAEYQVTNEPLAPTGAPTVQLIKTYGPSGGQSRVQEIYKITSSPAATLRKNGGAFVAFTLDVNTGLVTLTAVNSKSITAITQAASAVITVGAAHGFATNDKVYISGVAGMTQINGLVGTVTATGASTITTNITSTAFSAYTSGGTAAKYMTTTDTFDWTGDFRFPVNFDMQQQELNATYPFAREWQIALRERTS